MRKYFEFNASANEQELRREVNRLLPYPTPEFACLNVKYDDKASAKRALDNCSILGLAVRYLDTPEFVPSEKLAALEKEYNKAYDTYCAECSKTYAEIYPHSFTTCKKCGSRINTAYISSVYCPVCDINLTSAKRQAFLKSLEKESLSLQKQTDSLRAEEMTEHARNSTWKWLVKADYITLPTVRNQSWYEGFEREPYLYMDGWFRYKSMVTNRIECHFQPDGRCDVYLNLINITLEHDDGSVKRTEEEYVDCYEENQCFETVETQIAPLSSPGEISTQVAWG